MLSSSTPPCCPSSSWGLGSSLNDEYEPKGVVEVVGGESDRLLIYFSAATVSTENEIESQSKNVIIVFTDV